MVARRGTSNTNARGNNRQRKQRREAMVRNWQADVVLVVMEDGSTRTMTTALASLNYPHHETVPACRCWRCGELLTADTVTIDRWPVPGIDGGKYTATNTRPACSTCNPTTGATVRKGQSGQQEIVVTVDEIRV